MNTRWPSSRFKKLNRRLPDHKQKLFAETMNSIVLFAGVDGEAAEDMLGVAGDAPNFRNDLKQLSLGEI